jgi:MATE family multidrug resistance protein
LARERAAIGGDSHRRIEANRNAVSSLSHRTVLTLAVPVMLSNVSTALLGLVDTAVIGRYPDPAYLGAVAVGALIFTFVFWAFGFLRMGTTGLTAQAFGKGDQDEVAAGLGRALAIAAGVGVALMSLQWPIREVAFSWLGTSPTVEHLARGYFGVRIWAAPATLANYALFGWFIGRSRTDIGFVLQLVLNLANIGLNLLFVLGFDWGVRGVAAGTVLAEYIAALAGVIVALRQVGLVTARRSLQQIWLADRLKRAFTVNGDIMIRSLALMFAFVWFTAQSARQDDVTLAANSILMQFITFGALFLDGLAFAAEALVGRAIGAGDRPGFVSAARVTTLWAFIMALLLCVGFFAAGPSVINVVSVDSSVRAASNAFLPWAALAPVVGVWAFQLDGIFIGATRTAAMRNAMIVSLGIFLVGWWLLVPFGNQGLWAALYVHYAARIGTLLYCYPALLRSVGSFEH